MQETEIRFGRTLQLVPVGAHGFEQAEGADDIGLNEIFRAVDRAIDMRFGRKINHCARLVFSQQLADQIKVADIAVGKDMLGVAFETGEIFEIAGVGEFVEVDDRLIIVSQPVEHKIGADKAGTTSH